ncbi:MAG: hypothetical protein OWQ54_02610 [Sulfolobaceae archaeon]|nr:hypothetical protein [Sulfolobaceae archaeon]
MYCKDLDCVLKEANEILEEYKVPLRVNSVLFESLPFGQHARYENGTVYINSVHYEYITAESGNEYGIISSYLLLVILYAVLREYYGDDWKNKLLTIVNEKYGKDSIIYKMIEIVQL